MATIVVDGHGNPLGDVAPDLGSVYGQSNHARNRLRSSNHTVQNAIDSQDYSGGDTRRLLQKTLGLNPSREMIDFFSSLNEGHREEILQVWKAIRGTLKNKVIATSLGLTEDQDVIKQRGMEVGKLKDDLDVTINRANGEISQIKGALSDLTGKLKEALSTAQAEVSQNIKDVKSGSWLSYQKLPT